MSCEICGKGNCTRSFHSLDAQQEFDDIADDVKERCRRIVRNAVNSVEGRYIGNKYVIDLQDAIQAIDSADL